MNKKVNNAVLGLLLGSIFSAYALSEVIMQDMINESARMGAEMTSKTFDKVPTIIKVLPQAKEDVLNLIKKSVDSVTKVFASQDNREQLEQFFAELGALENPDEAAVNALLEKHPIAKEIQTGGVVEAFIAGIALVVAERCRISNEDALMIARVIYPLFLPKQ